MTVTAVRSQFKVFKTIELGTTMGNLDNFRASIKDINNSMCGIMTEDRKLKLSENARDVMKRIKFSNRPHKMDLAKVSLEQLGFKKEVPLVEIYQRAQERGLLKCSAEVGPQLRVQYLNQPTGERLLIGMEPISFSGFRDIFLVETDKLYLWLRAVCGNANGYWGSELNWLFVLPCE